VEADFRQLKMSNYVNLKSSIVQTVDEQCSKLKRRHIERLSDKEGSLRRPSNRSSVYDDCSKWIYGKLVKHKADELQQQIDLSYNYTAFYCPKKSKSFQKYQIHFFPSLLIFRALLCEVHLETKGANCFRSQIAFTSSQNSNIESGQLCVGMLLHLLL
jgi:hypothetical protein